MRPTSPADPLADPCVHTLFEAQAKKNPTGIAVVDEQRAISYGELDQRADRLAGALRSAGVRPGMLVGICFERSLDLVVAVLAILKAGGAYVPLATGLPDERLATIVRDAELKVVVAQRKYPEALDHQGVVIVHADISGGGSEEVGLSKSDASPASLAYVNYTSGTTGRPKGVMVSHRAAANHCLAVIERYHLGPGDRLVHFASVDVDVTFEEIFATLLSGATLVPLPDRIPNSIVEFEAFIEEKGATVLSLPAPYWHEWVRAMAAGAPRVSELVRLVIVGNDVMDPERFADWRRLVGARVRVMNAYGPTEAVVTATIYEPEGEDPPPGSPIPIGRAVGDRTTHLLDEAMRPVGPGETGELYIGGSLLADGYWGAPAMTEERFVSDPFSERPGARLYKTGDRARRLPDGNLVWLGRTDWQVKIRGFRVEFGEIEAVLARHPLVAEAVVTLHERGGDHRALVGYVVEDRAKKAKKRAELWPTPGDYMIYDELMYHAMTSDTRRVQAYRAAIEASVRDKVVLDVGTGQDFVLARASADAGAKRVYAIEGLESAYQIAKAAVTELGYGDRITVLLGEPGAVTLPESVDVCVSEIIGVIGNSEGAVSILNDATKFLRRGGVMLPRRCTTLIAAVTLQGRGLVEAPGFTETTAYYVEKIFEARRGPFDLRLCVKNVHASDLVSTADVFEHIEFDAPSDPSYERSIRLVIEADAAVDGFLLWLNLHVADGIVIDNLESPTSWLPVFFPVFYPAVDAKRGDVIEAAVSSAPSEDGRHPNYRVRGRLRRASGGDVDFEWISAWDEKRYQATPFYKALFSSSARLLDEHHQTKAKIDALREHLNRRLPCYMVPSTFVFLDSLPRGPSGKVNRAALPPPSQDARAFDEAAAASMTSAERQVAALWRDVLNIDRIDPHDDFFDLGGDSLRATRLVAHVRATLGIQLSLPMLFAAPTVAAMAAQLEGRLAAG